MSASHQIQAAVCSDEHPTRSEHQMKRILHHVHSNAVAYVALFVTLSGASYAASTLPPGSVGGRQIRNHAIDPIKFNNRFINGSVRAWAIVGSGGHVIAGGGKPRVLANAPSPGIYLVRWGVRLARNCAATASVDGAHSPTTERIPVPGNPSVPFTAGYAVTGKQGNATDVLTFNQSGQLTRLGFDLEVVC
jgi:hypothetical protein